MILFWSILMAKAPFDLFPEILFIISIPEAIYVSSIICQQAHSYIYRISLFKGLVSLKPYQEDKGSEGVFDKRNRVNNLTGKQWTFSTRSAKTKLFREHYPEGWIAKFPGLLPIELIQELIRTFSKPEDKILDPWALFGGTVIANILLGTKERRNLFYTNILKGETQLLCRTNGLETSEIVMSGRELPDDERVDMIFSQLVPSPYAPIISSQESAAVGQIWSGLSNILSFVESLKSDKYLAVSVANQFTENGSGDDLYLSLSSVVYKEIISSGLIPKAELLWLDTKISSSNLNDTRIWIFRKEE